MITTFAGFPMKNTSLKASVVAMVRQRINNEVRKPVEVDMRRIHSEQGGEFESHSVEDSCKWKRIIHTVIDRAQHESICLVERKIGFLNESV